MFRKILLATSPNVKKQAAPKAAFDLARKHGSELVLFHALTLERNSWGAVRDLVPEQELLKGTEERIREFYAEELEGIGDHSIQVTTETAHEAMLKVVHKQGFDLIVMGEHVCDTCESGRMLGMANTTIRKVCSNVFCPVLVVTDPAPQISGRLERIVVATDFATPSETALRYACDLARAENAHLSLFHVLDVGLSYPNPKYYLQDMHSFIQSAKDRMESRYSGLLKGIDHSLECWEGIPYTEVIKYARWQNADLIVMAQHSGTRESQKALIGSTVIQVALSPGCPVLIVNYRALSCQ
ncbi:universal stress protein [Pseudodesulfovibrio tunisiensis]|uniref:universal stress protein n=1 Tax=Pseudodesulfovibrio tunisiensis TaxID=463192 RepID=UPI001FB241C0|nr:universal stress protein [Pseudodesulfovibrio tunisiensis]